MLNENNDNMGFSTTSGTFATTGAATTHATTTTINYIIEGIGYIKTAITGGTTPTTDIITGLPITLTAGNARSVLWLLDASGNVAVTASPIVTWDGGTTAPNYGFASNVPAITGVPDGYAPFALQLLKGGSTLSGTWTFGSSNWNATGLTVVVKNVLTLPPRPILN